MEKFFKYSSAGLFGRLRKKSSKKEYTLDEAKAKLDEILEFLDSNNPNLYIKHNEDVTNGLVMIYNLPRLLTGIHDDDAIPINKFKQFQANLQIIAEYLGKTNYVEVFVKIATAFQDSLKSSEQQSRLYALNSLNLVLDSFRNFTDQCEILARNFGKFGGVKTLLNLLNYFSDSVDDVEQNCKDLVKSINQRSLAILHNCIRVCSDNRVVYRKANAVVALSELKDTFSSKHSKVFLVLILSYIVDEKESESLAKSEDCVRMLTNLLNKAVQQEGHYALTTDLNSSTAFSALELLDGLNHLAINDANKAEIEKQGGLSSIIQMLQPDSSEEERQVATKTMWKLAFLDSVKRNDEVQASVGTLQSLTVSENPAIREASTYTLWEIQDNQRRTTRDPPPSYQDSISAHAQKPSSGHVMISYQWDSQKRALYIRDKLKQEGYSVWMDIDKMRGDILDAMASAVENADVLLICMTEKYKDSSSCRSEASYASKKMKPIIPLLMEANYDPDGWLGILLGTKLYYKFFSDDHMASSMESLLKEIGNRGKGNSIADEIDGPVRPFVSDTEAASFPTSGGEPNQETPATVKNVTEWSTEQVQSWLCEIDLPELCSQLDFCDGNHLKEMYSQYEQSPDVFRNELKTDLDLGFRGLLKFTTALGQLFKST